MKLPGAVAPPRWMDPESDASPLLRRALAELGAERNDDERLARLEVRFAPLFGAPVTLARPIDVSPTVASAAPQGVLGASLIFKLGVVALVGGGLAFGVASSPRNAAVPVVQVARTASAVTARREAPLESNVEPVPPRVAPVPVEPPLQRAPELTSASPRRRIVAHAANAPDDVASVESTPPRAPETEQGVVASVAEEARLLRVARETLAVSPERALSLLGEHALRFPNCTLAEERELFTIEALVRNGENAAAGRRLADFRLANPRSPYLPRAERVVGGSSGTR